MSDEVKLNVMIKVLKEERDEWKRLAQSAILSFALSALILALVVAVWIITET
jgi:hypothetical protein